MTASPSACSKNGGTERLSNWCGSGFFAGYCEPSFLGRLERQTTCWCVITPPFAKIRPVSKRPDRNSRVIAVIAYARALVPGKL